jgi:hypothetical protein
LLLLKASAELLSPDALTPLIARIEEIARMLNRLHSRLKAPLIPNP